MKMTRRNAGRLLLSAPLAVAAAGPVADLLGARAAAGADEPATPPPEPEPTPLAKFLAKQEDGLTSEERERVRKDVTQIEDSLKTLREFKIANDVAPAGTFMAMKSRRATGERR